MNIEGYLCSKIEVTCDLAWLELEERLVDTVLTLEVNLSFRARGKFFSGSAAGRFDIL
jgi:hypothetical protein